MISVGSLRVKSRVVFRRSIVDLRERGLILDVEPILCH